MTIKLRLMAVFAALILAACGSGNNVDTGGGSGGGGGGGGGAEPPFSPSDSNEVMQKVGFSVGSSEGSLMSGNPPDDSGSATAPTVASGSQDQRLELDNGETRTVDFTFNTSTPLSFLFVKVAGASQFRQIPLQTLRKGIASMQTVTLEIQLPNNIRDGEFCLGASAQDSGGETSGPAVLCVDVHSDVDDFNPGDEVAADLQGDWTIGCVEPADSPGDSEIVNLMVFNNRVMAEESFWAGDTSCTGEPTEVVESLFTFEVGNEFLTADGVRANELNLTEITPEGVPTGTMIFEIIRMESNLFYLGDEASGDGSSERQRPMNLDFNTPWTRGETSGMPGGGGDGGSGVGVASDCYNSTLLDTGTTIQLTLQATDSGSGAVTDITDDRQVTGPAMFDGQDVIETQGTTMSTTGGITSTTNTTTYSQIDDPNMIMFTVGSNANGMEGGVSFDTTLTHTPPIEMRFNLGAGSFYASNYSTQNDSDVGGTMTSTTSDTMATVSFLGNESITVAGGTFDTCRFRIESATSSGGSTSNSTTNIWLDVGSGLPIQQIATGDSGTTTTELVSGSVNGVAID